jgi:hypothetical protein
MAFNLPGVPFRLQPEDVGAVDIASAFKGGQDIISNIIKQRLGKLQADKAKAELPYAGRQAMADAIAKELSNKMMQPRADLAPQFAQADLQKAQLEPQMTRQDILSKQIANMFSPGLLKEKLTGEQISNKYASQKAEAEIAEMLGRGQFYNQGGSRSAPAQANNRFLSAIAMDNPQLQGDQNKVREAANALREGKTTLSDGTQINPLSPDAKDALNQITKYGTFSGITVPLAKAEQAEAEMPVFDKYITKGLSNYGSTVKIPFLGQLSPKQIADSLNIKDEAAQKRLGEYIAADLLGFDRAALATRLAGTESGVTIIQEVMDKSKQNIDAKYPMLSTKARNIALQTVGKALREGLEARRTTAKNIYEVQGEKVPRRNEAPPSYEGGNNIKNPSQMTTEELRAEAGL